MPDTLINLPEPAYVVIQHPDGQRIFREDIYVVHRMLLKAQKQPSEDKRWEEIRSWIAAKLQAEPKDVTENMAIFLHNAVMKQVNSLNQELAKDFFESASSVESMEALLPNTETIQTG